MDVYARLRVPVGVRLLVGLHAVSVRGVELLQRIRLGMGAGNGRLHAVVGTGFLWRPQHRVCAYWVSPDFQTAPAARANRSQADAGDPGQPAHGARERTLACARQEQAGDDCGQHGDSDAPTDRTTRVLARHLHFRGESSYARRYGSRYGQWGDCYPALELFEQPSCRRNRNHAELYSPAAANAREPR